LQKPLDGFRFPFNNGNDEMNAFLPSDLTLLALGRCLIMRYLGLIALCVLCLTAPVQAGDLSGQYVEARTCDVYTGPCFANAEMNWGGKHAVMAWKVDKGSFDNVKLDGLAVVAVVAASDTLGLDQTGPSKAVLIVDEKATDAQKAALVGLARKQAGDLVRQVLSVERAKVQFDVLQCTEGGCATLKAGKAHIETRCIDSRHDKVCGNESTFYPPLSKGVNAKAAVAVNHGFSGKAFAETWKESERRGAFVGSFEIH
jgi:hypothetical protein